MPFKPVKGYSLRGSRKVLQRQAKCDTLPTSPLLSYWTKEADTKAWPRFVKPLSPMASQAVVLAEGI